MITKGNISEFLKVFLKQFSEEAIAKLQQRQWRGNIRELRNIVERLIILCGDIITVEDVDEYCN